MKKNNVSCWLVVCLCFLFVIQTASAEDGLVQITDQVYAYVDVKEATPAKSFGANAGIIIGKKGIAVIDTLVSAKEAKRFLQDIRTVSDKPILYVINTHYHLDHSFGNAEFSKLGVRIIAHENCGDEIRMKAVDGLANAKNYGLTAEDMTGTEIAYPDMTFAERMRLDLGGGVEVDLVYVAPSHSKGSIMVHVPDEKVVFAGDILFTDFHPYMADGDLKGWQQTLDFLATLEADKIIPGHGPLSDKKDVADMKAYIIAFDKKAKELAAGPGEIEDILITMKRFLPARAKGEWIIGANIQARYLKETGERKE